MKDKIKKYVSQLFAQGRISGFWALREQEGHVGPHLFTSEDRLDDLVLGDENGPGAVRYPLTKLLRPIYEADPTAVYAVLVRGCEERSLRRLFLDSVYQPDHIIPVGFACPEALAEACECAQPWPNALVAGDPAPAHPPRDEDAPLNLHQALTDWFDTFDRCVMCFGCRNICPVCSCQECTLQDEQFIPQRELPTSRNFLMTRAMHMVNRCVYCGMCEHACPAGIPLKGLYRLVARMSGRGLVFPQAGASQSASAPAEA